MNDFLSEARRLHALGFAIHWLYPKSKRPIGEGWTSGPRKTWEELEKSYRPGMNVGVRTGTPSRIGKGYLAVMDVDVKSSDPRHRKEAYAALKKLTAECVLPKVSSGRGNGSAHLYYQNAEPFQGFTAYHSEEWVKAHIPSKAVSKKDRESLSESDLKAGYRIARAWEIAVYSDGRQMVLPPSVHPDSEKRYEWVRPLVELTDLPVLEVSAPPRSVKDKTAGAKISLDGFKLEPVDLSWLPISDEVRAAIMTCEGVTDRSGYLLRATSALLSAGCNQNEVLTVLTDPAHALSACAYEHAKTTSRKRAALWLHRYTVGKVAQERSPEKIFPAAPPPARKLSADEQAAQAAEIMEDRDWKQDLERNQHGKIKVSLKNLDLILSNRVDGVPFVQDLFASRIMYGADTPWGGKKDVAIQDIDLLLVKRWLADTDLIEPSKETILEVTNLLAHRQSVHPVREWLESLKWDGKGRVNHWIRDFCQGDAPEPYLSEVSRKFLLAMVKRVFEPGCQWDYVLVLEGKQGKYKSSIARALASDRWFMDNLPDLKDKDSMLNLQGKWLIELGELADVKRADYNLVKAYLVRRTDTVRPHYGRLQTDVPRQSVFIGTINEGQYLKDPTGNRRYWPVKVGLCDVKGLKAVRDQLFAEAMHLYRHTEEILMLGPQANAQATEAQEDRRVEDDETEMRDAFLAFAETEEGRALLSGQFKTRDLMTGVNAPWGAWNDKKGYVLNIAAHVLSRAGFQKKKGTGGVRLWEAFPKGKN